MTRLEMSILFTAANLTKGKDSKCLVQDAVGDMIRTAWKHRMLSRSDYESLCDEQDISTSSCLDGIRKSKHPWGYLPGLTTWH